MRRYVYVCENARRDHHSSPVSLLACKWTQGAFVPNWFLMREACEKSALYPQWKGDSQGRFGDG